jgi:AcrR family transcriptional regulator
MIHQGRPGHHASTNVRVSLVSMSGDGRGGTRDAILDRAADLASVEGLERLTIGRLAGDLRLSKSGLFRHFGSKEELQLATVERAIQVLEREVVEPATKADPGLDRLRALLEGYLRYVEREVFSGGCFLFGAAAEFDSRPPGLVRDAIAQASRDWVSELERQAKAARKRGELAADTDVGQLVFELNALARAANASYQLHRDRRAFRRARRGIARQLSR